MHPIDFFFRLIADRITLTQDEYDNAKVTLQSAFDSSDNVVTRFLKSPYVLLLLPILFPIAQYGINWLLSRFINDEDQDGEIDTADLLALLAKKLDAGK